MKTQRLFSVCLLVATIVLCMNGCSDNDEIDPIGWVRLEQSSFEISGEAQTITVTLEVNNVPVVTDIQWMYPWITSCKKIEAVEGKNTSKEKYAITIETNDTKEIRSGNVDFYAKSIENYNTRASITITQQPLNP
ncbi:MAG: BACON domain-containing protein [Bacteroidaceae bacterium]|nr:BACON domain-containing protein [Bacteroidaceae bacterium]